MGRTGGEQTRKKILVTAEQLFAEKGYDGTGIQDIARSAGVNKALIYYHFKNKQDIIDSLFQKTLDEMFAMQGDVATETGGHVDSATVEARVAGIIGFLEKKVKIVKVMLMESLKDGDCGHLSLFQCAVMVMDKNINEAMHKVPEINGKTLQRNELLMHEFFTGFLPLVFFAIFKDKWADFFGCDKNEVIDLFLKVFRESHIRHK